MILIYILVTCIPVLMIGLVLVFVGIAGFKTAMNGKRAYKEIQPLLTDLQQKIVRTQQRGLEFARRAKVLSDAFGELQGRWAFVGGQFKETSKSPLAKFASMAGKRFGERGGRRS